MTILLVPIDYSTEEPGRGQGDDFERILVAKAAIHGTGKGGNLR
jgi:hypothetical protein